MGELSHVGLMQCYFCQEDKGILLHRRLRKTIPRRGTYDQEPCDKCAEWMRQGVILISVRDGEMEKEANASLKAQAEWERGPRRHPFVYIEDPYRTGGWCVVTEEAIRGMMPDPEMQATVLKRRMCWVEDAAWDWMGLPRE